MKGATREEGKAPRCRSKSPNGTKSTIPTTASRSPPLRYINVQATYAQALEALGWKDEANERGRNASLIFFMTGPRALPVSPTRPAKFSEYSVNSFKPRKLSDNLKNKNSQKNAQSLL